MNLSSILMEEAPLLDFWMDILATVLKTFIYIYIYVITYILINIHEAMAFCRDFVF